MIGSGASQSQGVWAVIVICVLCYRVCCLWWTFHRVVNSL